MSNEITNVPPTPAPHPDLQQLGRLVGTWRVTGGAEGTAAFQWMDGGHFLIQHVDLEQYGQRVQGIEVIGHNRDFGAEADPEIRSCFYDNTGNTLRYVYEPDGDTLTIWGGEKGSPAFFRGTFTADGGELDGEWTYPGGDGYRSTMIRTAV